jgi:asparagine synthetase A
MASFFLKGILVSKLVIPEGYRSVLSVYDTQIAISGIKRLFEDNLSQALNLMRVSAPLFVDPETGLNDNLNGVERPVEFGIKETQKNAQIAKADCDSRRRLPFHKSLLAGEMPLSIGGGIGQSRLCMFMLQKAHVGEVQVSVWDEGTLSGCEAAGIKLL